MDKIVSPSLNGQWLSAQLQCFGGKNSRFSTNAENGTSYSVSFIHRKDLKEIARNSETKPRVVSGETRHSVLPLTISTSQRRGRTQNTGRLRMTSKPLVPMESSVSRIDEYYGGAMEASTWTQCGIPITMTGRNMTGLGVLAKWRIQMVCLRQMCSV